MDPITTAVLSIGLFTLLKGSSKSTSSTSKKFIPSPQPSFKSNLDIISKDLEKKLEIDGLRDILMGIAWVESKYIPSAIRYESNGYNLVYPSCPSDNKNCDRKIKKKFAGNKWAKSPYLWNYTGGLFQMFPATALSVDGDVAVNFNPTTVFKPLYTIAYAIDFASRLNKYYDANTWMDIRLGWHSLSLLSKKTPNIVQAVEGRIVKGINNSNGNIKHLYDYNEYNFSTYRSEYGFTKVLSYLKDKYGDTVVS